MSSSSFGQWYDDKRAEESGTPSSSSWFPSTEDVLPLFNVSTESIPTISWDGMKSSMEAQMPQKVMGMGYQQRFKVFCAILFLSALFFALAFFVGLPMITVRPQKFALSFTMGSLMFMFSFAILKGPKEHLMSMLQRERLYFTTIYVGSMLSTLYFTFSFGGLRGYAMVIAASGVQLAALLWYLISFLPGGAAGLKYVMAVMGHLLRPVLVMCGRCQAYCLAGCYRICMQRGGAAE
ncbi:hypothetical protein MPSEU_000228300 [Mayamaea pseudoterrestris]|nr:hypothetical protein MPSEU_000228300 [Mayamaea pseudoterrestris]